MLKPARTSILYISSMKNEATPPRLSFLLVVVCVFVFTLGLNAAALVPPQGPIGGAQIATLAAISGDVRVSRAAAPGNVVPISDRAIGLALANGDTVQTLRGRAEIRFNDASVVKLFEGTVVVVQEQPTAGGIQRTISQIIGSLWFNIQKLTGSTTTLETPTAVAAIRGTQGQQDVPGPDQSTHTLSEGIQLVTEKLTRQSVTIRAGQQVTAIRGIGFLPVVALVGLLSEPAVGGPGGGVGAGAGAGAAPATGTTIATTTVATTSISSLTASVVSIAVPAGTIAATTSIPLAAQSSETKSTPTDPLVRPGGALTRLDGGGGVAVSAPTGSSFVSGLGGTIPMTAASGSIWALGAITHNARVIGTGRKTTEAVFAADAIAGVIRAARRNQTFAAGNALRTFAFASVIGRQYRDKPLVVIGAYGFAAAASYSQSPNQKRFPADVLISAVAGEIIGRLVTHHRERK